MPWDVLDFLNHQPASGVVWVTVVLSVVGILMASPTLLDRIWDKPIPAIEFGHLDAASARAFTARVSNAPIANRALRALVKRDSPVTVTAWLTVAEDGGKTLMLGERLKGGGDSLLHNQASSELYVVAQVRNGGTATVETALRALELEEGFYVFTLGVLMGGVAERLVTNRIRVFPGNPWSSTWVN